MSLVSACVLGCKALSYWNEKGETIIKHIGFLCGFDVYLIWFAKLACVSHSVLTLGMLFFDFWREYEHQQQRMFLKCLVSVDAVSQMSSDCCFQDYFVREVFLDYRSNKKQDFRSNKNATNNYFLLFFKHSRNCCWIIVPKTCTTNVCLFLYVASSVTQKTQQTSKRLYFTSLCRSVKLEVRVHFMRHCVYNAHNLLILRLFLITEQTEMFSKGLCTSQTLILDFWNHHIE